MNWATKRVLICGGAGMIGSHLARRLVGMGSKVVVTDNLSSGSLQNIADIVGALRFVKVDLRDVGECVGLFRDEGKFDCVFQLAANMGGIGYITAIGADIMRDSALINLNMLETARQYGVALYFYSSSACIYPEYRQINEDVVPLKESDAYPAQPDQYYGWEKLFTEKLCEAYIKDYGMNIRVARFHNVYGEAYTAFDEQKAKAPCKMLLRAMLYPKQSIEIWNDGRQTRSFLYIDDCIDAVLKLMDSGYKEPINIGSDFLVSMNELAQIVSAVVGKDITPKYYPDKPQGVRGRNSDNTLSKKVLNGWEPRYSLSEGLQQVYKWTLPRIHKLEGVENLTGVHQEA